MFTQFQIHLPLDPSAPPSSQTNTISGILFPDSGFDLLGAHQEGAVPDHGQHLRIGFGQSDTERPGQREGRSRQAVGDGAGVRLIGRVEASHPHLRRTGVDKHDVAAAQRARVSATTRCWASGKRESD
jgi:hypothetical protein